MFYGAVKLDSLEDMTSANHDWPCHKLLSQISTRKVITVVINSTGQ